MVDKGYSIFSLLNNYEISCILSELQLLQPNDRFNPEGSLTKATYHLTDFDSSIEYKIKAKELITKFLEPHLKDVFDDYKIITTNFIIKPPSKGNFCVHQDWTFVSDPNNYTSLTLWCPLVDTCEENGTLQVVESSHKIVSDIATSTVDFYCKKFESEIRSKYGKLICLKAGECVVFDHSLLHFSGENYTAQPRYVMQAILIPNELKPVFYYFDSNDPSKGFEVFQANPEFFIFQNFLQRPSNLKSLGFIENRNKLLTEGEFIEKMADGQKIREKIYFKSKPSQDRGIKKNFESIFNLLRGQDWWFYKIPPLLAISYAEILIQDVSAHSSFTILLTLTISMFFVAAYGHVMNDIFDIEVDEKAGKLNRMASLSRGQRTGLSLGLAVLGLFPWWWIGFNTTSSILLGAIYLLLTIYPAPPLRLKERFIFGAIADAATVHAVPTLLVATVFASLTASSALSNNLFEIIATAWAFAVGVRGILLHQIWDRDNDLKSGLQTLATKLGAGTLRFWINHLVFPVEVVLSIALALAIAQSAPLFLVPCAAYFLILFLMIQDEFNPSPIEKSYVVLHDFYEVWLPLSLLILLSTYRPIFIILLAVHVALFYPVIQQRILVSVSQIKLNLAKMIFFQSRSAVNTLNNQSQAKSFLPQPFNELEQSLVQAIEFLTDNQLEDGEFPTYSNDAQSETDSSPFVTALVLYSLSFLAWDNFQNKVKSVTDQGLKFLVREMEQGGLWRYWSSKNKRHAQIPPDLDDICCISHLLKLNNLSIPKNRSIILGNRDRVGLFYTWVVPRSLQSLSLNIITIGKALSHSDQLWQLTNKDDVCCVVNANVLLYLGETLQTEQSLEYVIDTVLSGKEEERSAFYNHKLSFYYMLSRAYFNGVTSLNVVKTPIITQIGNLQQADGSYGNELLTALAICTLINFNYVVPSLDKAIQFLLNAQQSDGSWPRIPMYGGQLDKNFFGSAALTTGFCIEALARYRLLNLVVSKQETSTTLTPQRQKELKDYGYVVLDNFLSEAELQDLRKFDRAHPLPEDIAALCNSTNISSTDIAYRQQVDNRLKAIVNPKIAALLPNHRAAFCTWYRKSPNSSTNATPLHQDPSLTTEPDTLAYGIWCPLVDVDPDNGCLHVVKGSHTLNSQPRPFHPFSPFPYDDALADLLQARYLTPIPLKAGQAILYNKRLFHSATANPTSTERVAFTCLIAPGDQPTHFGYRSSPDSNTLELFAVQDDFYNRYIFGDRPNGDGVRLIGTVNYGYDPLTPELIAEKLDPLHPERTSAAAFDSSPSPNPEASPPPDQPEPEPMPSESLLTPAQLEQIQDHLLTSPQTEQFRDFLKSFHEQLQRLQSNAVRDRHQTQTELANLRAELTQAQTAWQAAQTEAAQLKAFLHSHGSEVVMDYYRQAIAADPDNLPLYEQAIALQPDDAQLHLQLGRRFIQQGQLDAAISRYQTAIQHCPNHFNLHLELAKALETAKRGKEAIAAYRRALALNPQSAIGHERLGNTLAAQGQLNEASAVYRRSLQLHS